MSREEYEAVSDKLDKLTDLLTDPQQGLFVRLDRQEQRMAIVTWLGGALVGAILVASVSATYAFVGRMNALEARQTSTPAAANVNH